MKALHAVAFALVVIGGLNWGLVGAGSLMGNDWNLVNMILGAWPMVESIVYVLVGASALVLVFTHKRDCRMCGSGGMAM